MVLKGKGKYYKRNSVGYIYIPYDIVIDSSFPFKHKEEVDITIEGGKIVVEKGASLL